MEPCEYLKEIKIRTDSQSGQLCFFDPQHPLAQKERHGIAGSAPDVPTGRVLAATRRDCPL